MKKTLKKRWILTFVLFISALFFFYFQNNVIGVTKLSVHSTNIPPNFNQYKIVHLSDLHNKMFGKEQGKLVGKVKSENPNVIVFTGDLIDRKNDQEENSLILMKKLVNIAPVYFVTGNHEWWAGDVSRLEDELERIGVHVLRNAAAVIHEGNDTVELVGIDDPASGADPKKSINHTLEGIERENYKILLSHRPELLHLYAHHQFDLVFSGHAHGGQFRIPFIGGVVAPNQGFFPKYTSGKHTDGDTTMIVSRGLGNSIIPVRIFNRPELITVILEVERPK